MENLNISSPDSFSSNNSLNGHSNGLMSEGVIAPDGVSRGEERSAKAPLPQRRGDGKVALAFNVLRRGAKSPARGDGQMNDPLPRRRDEEGEPLSRRMQFISPGLLSGRPLKETPLAELLEAIKEHYPIRSSLLAFEYEDGLRYNKAQFDDLERLITESLRERNAEIERRNAAICALQHELEREREDKVASDVAALRECAQPLSEAHREAAKAFAKAGASYNPNNASEADVLREKPLPLEVVRGQHGLPSTENDDAKRPSTQMLLALKCGVAVAIGVSIGIFGRFFEVETIGQKPVELAVLVGIGWVVATFGALAMRASAARAAERYYLARYNDFGPLYWMPSTALAVLVGSVLMGAEATIEALAIFSKAQIESASSGSATLPLWMFALIGLLITLGYIVTLANEGCRDGRRHVIHEHSLALQYEEFMTRNIKQREQATVIEALTRLSEVHAVQHGAQAIEARIAAERELYNHRIEHLEGEKRAPEETPSKADLERLRDAFDNMVGSNSECRGDIQAIINQIEPLRRASQRVGLWGRIKQWWHKR